MMTDYANARKRLVLLHAEAERIGKFITYVGASIQHPNPSASTKIEDDHFKALDAEKIKSLVEDIKETSETISSLREKLSTLGLL